MENLTHKFSEIGLEGIDLSFLNEMTSLSRGNTMQQLNMEIELAKDDLDAGKRVRWCKRKKMIVNDNDCSSPVFGKGCANWKNGECIKP